MIVASDSRKGKITVVRPNLVRQQALTASLSEEQVAQIILTQTAAALGPVAASLPA
jgi:hypothetical protein